MGWGVVNWGTFEEVGWWSVAVVVVVVYPGVKWGKGEEGDV